MVQAVRTESGSPTALFFFLKTAHAPSIVITDSITPAIQRLATVVIQQPVSLDEFATPQLYVLPMYSFGYEMALQRG